MNRALSAGRVRARPRGYAFSVRSLASAPGALVIAAAGVVVIASEQTWRTALFAVVIAAAIAATRVRFALHAAAVLLVVLAVLAGAGTGAGAGSPTRLHPRSSGQRSTRGRQAGGRTTSVGARVEARSAGS